jgi:hypothetical protein
VTQQRRTLLACLQDLSQHLQASHGQNCIDAAHALAREQAAAAAASRPPARDENAMASMMHLARIRSRLEAATKRAAQANAACLDAEREKDAAQQAVQELERELQSHCPKRARTAEQDDEPTEAVAEWDLSTFRREFTRVSGRRNIAITDRQHCLETRRGKYNFLNHPRLGLLGWMAYWSHGVQSIVVTMIVDLIKELGLGLQVIAGLPEGQEARAQAATNEHIVDRLKACLSELKHGQKRQTEEQRKQYIQILAAVMPVRARERDSAGWIRRVCERLDVSRGSRNARQYFLREMAPPGRGCVVWTFGLVSAPSYPCHLSRSQPRALATHANSGAAGLRPPPLFSTINPRLNLHAIRSAVRLPRASQPCSYP